MTNQELATLKHRIEADEVAAVDSLLAANAGSFEVLAPEIGNDHV